LKTKVAAILLFLGLCAPVVLSFNYLRIQKKLIRKEVKHHLIEQTKLDDLVLLSFSVEESQEILKWKHEKEFEFDGEMYDVVKRESRGDSLFYWCWWDHEETQLNRQLDILLAKALGSHPDHKSQKQRLKHFLQNLYHCQLLVSSFQENREHLPSPPYVFTVKPFDIRPPFHPPENALS
jgi:hypothetical protein